MTNPSSPIQIAALGIIDPNHCRAAAAGIPNQFLPSAPVNAMKTEIDRIGRHDLVAHESPPDGRHAREGPQARRVPANFDLGHAVYHDLNSALGMGQSQPDESRSG